MSRQYFGTDGIRGVAGEAPLDDATVYAIGQALGEDFGPGARVVMAEDTRESSAGIAHTLAAGLSRHGVAVDHAGVLPTPAVAFLAHHGGYRAGVMISASHNPYQDNGIKLFGASGFKLPDDEELQIEAAIDRHRASGAIGNPPRQVWREAPELRARYIRSLQERFAGVGFSGIAIVVDCAHGAASAVVEELFAGLGFRTRLSACAPDGRNINAGVGALHPEVMAAAVVAAHADAGLALDGDADRAILADARGGIVNGDSVLLMMARERQSRGRLEPPVVVGTVMTNFGLELALQREGIRLERAPVGDKYVLERMQALGADLGGEPSGHVIFAEEATTGDGLLTALHCFAWMARQQRPLADLCDGWLKLPQRIANVRVREKLPLEDLPQVQSAIHEAEAHFQGTGRVLVRYSGTERLARVMVEAESAAAVEAHADRIATAIRSAIGA